MVETGKKSGDAAEEGLEAAEAVVVIGKAVFLGKLIRSYVERKSLQGLRKWNCRK